MTAADLSRLVAPSTIAAVGASTGRERLSGRTIENLRRFGFEGHVHPVNPDRAEVAGLPSVASIADVPGSVDVAFVSVPVRAVEQSLREAASVGVPFAIVLTAGYEGPAGAAARQSLEHCIADVRAQGMRVLGPNCIGVVCPGHNMMLRPAMFVRTMPAPGGICVISQSGGLSLAMLNEAAAWGIGLTQLVHTGNEFDLGIEDFLAHAAVEPQCTSIAVSVEQIRRPELFAEHARTARKNGKRLVYLKVGRSERGVEASMTHTGALAGDAAVYDAFLTDLGFLRVNTPRELLQAADQLWPTWDDARKAVGVVTISGGEAGLAADLAELAGVTLSAPLELPRLASHIGADAANPVDVTGRVFGEPELIEEAVLDLLEAPEAGPVVVSFPPMSAHHLAQFTAPLAKAARAGAGIAVICSSVSEDPFSSAAELRRSGVAAFESLSDAFWKFGLLSSQQANREAGGAPELASREAVHLSGFADLMSSIGLPVATPHPWDDVDPLPVDFPIALKLEHPRVFHRAVHGLVALSVSDRPSALRSAETMRARAGDLGLDQSIVVVQAMADLENPREIIVGYRRDPVFGPVFIVGRGGVDAGVGHTPGNDSLLQVLTTPAQAASRAVATADERGWLTGLSPTDRTTVADVLIDIWGFAESQQFTEFEVNPLLVASSGGCLIVDAVGWR